MIVYVEALLNGSVFDLSSEVERFIYSESLSGFATFTLNVLSGDWSKWNVFITGRENQTLRLRWVIASGSKTTVSEWRNVRVARIKCQYVPGGVTVYLYGFDVGSVMLERCHKNAFKDKRISDMVTKIAQQNGFKSRVRPTLDVHSIYQCEMDDSTFIRTVLLPHTVDVGKYGGYNFYMENGNTVVFEPPSLDVSKIGTFGVNASTTDKVDHVTDLLEVDFAPSRQVLEGHISTEVRGFDTVEKVPVTWTADDDTVPFKKLASTSPQSPNIPAVIVPSTMLSHGKTPPGELEQHAIGLWSQHARSLFRTQVMVTPPIVANVLGKTVNLIVRDGGGSLHYATGKWFIEGLEQNFSMKGPVQATSILKLARRTYHK